jgi:Mlc titration factor MtfA (ptsG expression regulator)
MLLVFKIVIVGFLIVLVILIAFSIRTVKQPTYLPENYKQLLWDYIAFYRELDEAGMEVFEKRIEHFLSAHKITGINAEVEDLDIILIASAAIIPVFSIPDWQYINLHEVLLYPGTFNADFDQAGQDRNIIGMVGSGALQHVMVLSKWQLRQGFINAHDARNTAIHEFVHLIDKMDGTVDGVPEILLERTYTGRWKQLMETTIEQMKTHGSDIDMYGATNTAEFFAVISEYFFKQPQLLQANHPEVFEMLVRIYKTNRQ